MRFAASALLVGSLASLATAVAQPAFNFPDAVPLSKRQTSGPAYECHASCGYAIQNSAKDGYCKDQSWTKLLDDCLNCALKYDIWKYYGTKVGVAAKACGLDATPKPADGGVSTTVQPTTAAPSTTPVSTGTQQMTPGQTTPVASQSTSAPAPSTSVVVGTTTLKTTGGTTAAPTHNATTTGTQTVTAGGSQNMLSGLVVAGAAALLVANLC